ncbi:MAG TPA: prolyl oligopeptidase family serine peptidase [Thermoanaerobaculia bacterium]|nr:prolyl oligopeptidase family serine peptidase [Thermoanaerobaculia bacterium]
MSWFSRVHSALAWGAVCVFALAAAPATQKPPTTRQDNFKEVLHGVEIVDPYRWLEDQESPETRQWIETQNQYTQSLLGSLPVRAKVRERLTELMRVDLSRAPTEYKEDIYFLNKKRAEDDLWTVYLRRGLRGQDEVLLDPHTLSEDHTTDVDVLDVSPDGKLMAYGIRRGGEDEVEMRVLDVMTRKELPERFPRFLYRGVVFKPDKSGFYYNLQDRKKGIRAYYHALGTDPAKDVEVFGEGYGPDKWLGAQEISDDGRWLLFVVTHGWARQEVYLQDLKSGGPIRPVVNDLDAHFSPSFAGNRLVLMTDWQASNKRILLVDPENPGRDQWKEVVPAGSDAILGYALIGGKIFVHYLHDVASQIRIFTPDGKPAGELPVPGLGSVSGPWGRWEGKQAFFDFQSYTTPRSTFRYDLETGKAELWGRDEVPFQPEGFETKQVWYTSKDGTRVPMFLVHKKGLKPDGKTPTLLYGYGGFRVSQRPSFSSQVAWWIEQGGVYALANLRGGSELGEDWHRAGMLEKKQNVFDDFLAAAEWLIANGYTNPSKLAIQGGSNGGLLVGAALTQRPDLFQAVLCQFPDLDMLGYYRFKNNNPPALLEYGDASKPEHFKFLQAYSPYHKVKPGVKYPAVLLTTGDADTRVPPLQARKMTARLQTSTASDRPVLLRYDTKAGHAGGRPLGKLIDDLSLEMAFLAWQLGMEEWTASSTILRPGCQKSQP